jgi:putative PIN family toxin of toxin-antitoxin system
MRVVLDTNILARAAYSFGGPAAEVLGRLREPGQTLIASEFLLGEVGRVLRYPRLARYHGLNSEAIDRFVADVAGASLLVETAPTTVEGIVPSDPDDDSIVATAVVGKANVLCTLDKHLYQPAVVTYCSAQGIRILNDVDLLALLRADVAHD